MVWVTTEGGDFDNTALQLYKDAMKAAKVRAGCLVSNLVISTASMQSYNVCQQVAHKHVQL